MTYRAATFNIWHHLSDARRRDDFLDLLATPNLTVAGLQEITWYIEDTGWLPEGWAVWQPLSGRPERKDPIVWDTREWELIEKDHRLISERIENDYGTVAARHGVWVVLRNRRTGEVVGFVNWHGNASVEGPAGNRKHIPRSREHHDGLVGLIEIRDDLRARYDCPVLIVGDFNVDYSADKAEQDAWFPYVMFTEAGLHCVWELGEQSTRTGKPNTGRTIDHAWATPDVTFTDVMTPTHWGSWRKGDVESDHLPVIFDFNFTQAEAESPAREEENDVPLDIRWWPSPNNSGGDYDKWFICIHATVSREIGRGAEQVAGWFADPDFNASTQYVVDNSDVIQCVRETAYSWSAGTTANIHGIHIELVGMPGQSRKGWSDDYSDDELRLAARLTAELCAKYDIPIRKVGPGDLRARRGGIAGHDDVRDAWHETTHWDPGPNFPWGRFIRYVREAAGEEGDWFDMATKADLEDVLRNTRFTIEAGDERKEWRLETWVHHQENELDDITQRLKALTSLVEAVALKPEELSNLVASKINVDVTADAETVKQAVKDAIRELVEA